MNQEKIEAYMRLAASGEIYDSVDEELLLAQHECVERLDQFCAASPSINEAYNEWWLDYIDHSGITPEAKNRWLARKKLDRENSVPATIGLLREAGFEEVDQRVRVHEVCHGCGSEEIEAKRLTGTVCQSSLSHVVPLL